MSSKIDQATVPPTLLDSSIAARTPTEGRTYWDIKYRTDRTELQIGEVNGCIARKTESGARRGVKHALQLTPVAAIAERN